MAENKTGGRGHPVKGRNRGGQLRALFAKGVLRGRGKGKSRSVTRVGSRSVLSGKSGGAAKSGVGPAGQRRGLGKRKNDAGNPYARTRTVIGGSKAATLRGGSSAPTRESRIAAGRSIANRPEVARRALKGSGLRVKEAPHRPGLPASQHSGPLLATGKHTRLGGDTRFLVRTARAEGKLPQRSLRKKGSPAYAATRAERIAAGKKIADAHPEVKLWGSNREGLKRANAYRASTAPLRRQQAAQRKVDIAKATDRYTKALTKANTELMDAKAQRSKRRAYDKLISTISGGFKSKRHAYKSEIDSALRRATYSARKAGALIL